MVASKTTDNLAPWLRDAKDSDRALFASGIGDDEPAVRAAIFEPWSNGQTKCQVFKLKLTRIQMYGGGNINLVRARMGRPG